MVGFFLIKRDDKITQAVRRGLKRLIRLEERNRRRDFATKNSRGVLAQFIEENCQPQRCR